MKKVEELERLRTEFRFLRQNGEYIAGNQWFTAVKKCLKSDNPTPEEWIAAAKLVRVKCDCCRNGTYYWGACINGVMQYARACVRCRGQGTQNYEDHARNRYYDNHRRII